MAKSHYIKTLTKYFQDVSLRKKTFELRFNDRKYEVGDVLVLQDFDGEKLTGNEVSRTVTYILDDAEKFGLMKGFVILAME